MKFSNLFLIFFLGITIFSVNAFAEQQEIKLIPTDDAYVIADLQDTADTNNLRTFNSGNLDHLKIGYAINTTTIPNQHLSTALLKFDLANLSDKQIDSVSLKLYASQIQLSEPQEVGVFLVSDSTWNESTLTYDNMPTLSSLISTVTIDDANYYQWDLGNLIQQDDTHLSLMVSFVTLLPNTENVIIFASKDSSPEYYPTLIINTSPINDAQNILKIIPTDDSFIGVDFTTPDDPFDLRTTNFGDSEFIKIWYSNNVTSTQEVIVTSGLLIFDLSEIDVEDILSVNLNMKTLRVDSSGGDKILSVSKLDNSSWSESEITFNNQPVFDIQDSFLAEINQSNSWHTWDVTSFVKNNADSKVSLSFSYATMYSGYEEQTLFHSKESPFSPYLEVILKEKEGGGCLIATATYGSELAPQVQQLRELRDNYLLPTESGTIFMTGFNSMYYSFSPVIADLERSNPLFRELVKITITPMISSLSILHYVDMDSEYSVLGYGLSIIMLNVGIYFVSPVIGLKIAKKYIHNI